MKEKNFSSIELLRFLSSVSVILFHYKVIFLWKYGEYAYFISDNNLPFSKILYYLYNYGIYGVYVFFTISGFVFSYVYSNKKNVLFKSFFINRLGRLYPLHLLTLSIFIIFFFINIDLLNNIYQKVINGNESSALFDFKHLILNLFFIHAWGFENGFSFNTPSWSVSVEILIYLSFFFFHFFFKKKKIMTCVLFILCFFVLYKVQILKIKYSEFFFLFYSGVLINLINLEKKIIYSMFISIFLIFFSFIGNFKILLFCPGILILSILSDNFIKNPIIINLFNFLGNTTYSSYLLHFPYMILFIIFENKYLFFNKIYENNIFFLIYFITLFFFSALIFYFYELPLNKKIRKKFN